MLSYLWEPLVLQWICTLNNISRQIYLTDNPEVGLCQKTSHTTAFDIRREISRGALPAYLNLTDSGTFSPSK